MNQNQSNATSAKVNRSGAKVRCSAWLARVKAWAMILLIAAGVAVLIGGCVRIDYGVFKAKYPNADTGDYIWSKLFHK